MDETEPGFSQQIIKEQLSDEIDNRWENEMDPLALSYDQKEEIVANECNNDVEKVYIKEEHELVEYVKKENENIYNADEYTNLEDYRQSMDVKDNISICPEINICVSNTRNIKQQKKMGNNNRSNSWWSPFPFCFKYEYSFSSLPKREDEFAEPMRESVQIKTEKCCLEDESQPITSRYCCHRCISGLKSITYYSYS